MRALLTLSLSLLPAAALCGQTDSAPQAADAAAKAPAPVADSAQFYFATYPDFLVQFDPVTDEVVRKIQFQNGMPWSINLLHDNNRFAVVTDQRKKVEIIDRRLGEVTSVHDFSEDGYIIRVRSIREIPGGKQWYVTLDRIKKELDRYKFESAQYLLSDVEKQEVVKKLRRLPQALGRGARISPCGKYWHVFGRGGDLQILDPESLDEVAKIDLSTPLFTGMPRLTIGRTDLFDGENPKMYRMLCTLSDKVQKNRTTWGYVDIDLENHKIGDLVEWGLGPSGWGTYVAKDAKRAVARGSSLRSSGDTHQQIVLYDLENGRKLREFSVEFRPRQSLSGISPDGSKVYIGGAGSDFMVYDADTLEKIRTVELDGELYGRIHVLDP
ncbi:MAG: hypothetical protein VYE77_10740 [Planctomycetota bacterium]|nr:hypothetical protein [Planctomycetota bacterium]